MSLATIQSQDPTAAFCIAKTLDLEGGLADNPSDPGGITNHGVSLRWALAEIAAEPADARWLDTDHDGHVDRKDIIGLARDDAADVYYACWWLPGWYRRLVPQLVAWKCFDIAVNAGPKRSALILQKALQGLGADIAVDAGIGAGTVAAVKREADLDHGEELLAAIRTGQAAFYRRLSEREPKLEPFLKGWLARAAV